MSRLSLAGVRPRRLWHAVALAAAAGAMAVMSGAGANAQTQSLADSHLPPPFVSAVFACQSRHTNLCLIPIKSSGGAGTAIIAYDRTRYPKLHAAAGWVQYDVTTVSKSTVTGPAWFISEYHGAWIAQMRWAPNQRLCAGALPVVSGTEVRMGLTACGKWYVVWPNPDGGPMFLLEYGVEPGGRSTGEIRSATAGPYNQAHVYWVGVAGPHTAVQSWRAIYDDQAHAG